jgi:nitrite reductase/ring-hydroxylating ferredoxin subunit
MDGKSSEESGDKWFKVCERGEPQEGKRIHQVVDGRYVTIFRVKGTLSAIDAICHHAGGPLTLGPLQDIEELGGMTVVSCPWHKFLVSITDGTKAYQEVAIEGGVPKVKGWKQGKIVQRAFKVVENDTGVYMV